MSTITACLGRNNGHPLWEFLPADLSVMYVCSYQWFYSDEITDKIQSFTKVCKCFLQKQEEVWGWWTVSETTCIYLHEEPNCDIPTKRDISPVIYIPSNAATWLIWIAYPSMLASFYQLYGTAAHTIYGNNIADPNQGVMKAGVHHLFLSY